MRMSSKTDRPGSFWWDDFTYRATTCDPGILKNAFSAAAREYVRKAAACCKVASVVLILPCTSSREKRRTRSLRLRARPKGTRSKVPTSRQIIRANETLNLQTTLCWRTPFFRQFFCSSPPSSSKTRHSFNFFSGWNIFATRLIFLEPRL